MKNRPIIDAVTAVLVCADKLFIIKRQNHLKAFPGYHAFPGGKVDHDESEVEFQCSILRKYPVRLMRALCRELSEELEYDVEKACENGDILSIDELGVAVTPDFNPYRFKTYFYRIELKFEQQFCVDVNEVQSAEWKSSRRILDEFYAGRVLAVPPVITLLKQLGQDICTRVIEDLDFTYDSDKEVPWIESIHNLRQLIPLSNTLPPVHRTNCFVIGDKGEARYVVDPSPRDEEEYQKLCYTLDQIGFTHIFLTHHHPDHYEYADVLAKKYQVPMKMSQDTYDRISKKKPHFFEGIKIETASDGDKLTLWNDKIVRVYAVPGHDEGQLALAPESMEWFIVGDLIQGVGTVVVGGDEGDMQKYMLSLQKVIDLDPAIIIPSHGIAMGGTFRLQKTLEHRHIREQQVLKLHVEGKNKQEMLAEMYKGTPRELHVFALANIESHLEKLRKEKKL